MQAPSISLSSLSLISYIFFFSMFTSFVFNVFFNSKWEDIYISWWDWKVASYNCKAYYSILGIHGMKLGEVVPWFLFFPVTTCKNKQTNDAGIKTSRRRIALKMLKTRYGCKVNGVTNGVDTLMLLVCIYNPYLVCRLYSLLCIFIVQILRDCK